MVRLRLINVMAQLHTTFNILYLPWLSMVRRKINHNFMILCHISSNAFPTSDSEFRNIYLITAIVIERCLLDSHESKKAEQWNDPHTRTKTGKKCVSHWNSNQQTKSSSLNATQPLSHVDSIKRNAIKSAHKHTYDGEMVMWCDAMRWDERVFDVWKFFILLLLPPL